MKENDDNETTRQLIESKCDYYLKHNFNKAAKHLCEYHLLLLQTDGNGQKIAWKDVYRYLLALERLGEFHNVIRSFESQSSPFLNSPLDVDVLECFIIYVQALVKTGANEKALIVLDNVFSKIDKLDIASHRAALLQIKADLERQKYRNEIVKDIKEEIYRLDPFFLNFKDFDLAKLDPKLSLIIEAFINGNYQNCIRLIHTRKSLVEPEWKDEMMAICFSELGLLDELERLLNECKINSIAPEKLSFIHALHAQISGHNDEARRHLAKATQINEHYTASWLCLGHSYASLGDHEQAISAYSHILRFTNDKNIHALLSMAGQFLRVNQHARASPYLHTAATIAPNDPFVIHELGTLFYIRGDIGKAIEAFRKAEAMFSTSSFGSLAKRNRLMASLKYSEQLGDPSLLRLTLLEFSKDKDIRKYPLILELLSLFSSNSQEKTSLTTAALSSRAIKPFTLKNLNIVQRLLKELN